ncbi:MAG: hypothetical protein EOO65_00105 [Methanosarcinales archaeon]|nr:MAG: hypothetical protein EOO65_00105 [Methanosarcinales archaeon]
MTGLHSDCLEAVINGCQQKKAARFVAPFPSTLYTAELYHKLTPTDDSVHQLFFLFSAYCAVIARGSGCKQMSTYVQERKWKLGKSGACCCC